MESEVAVLRSRMDALEKQRGEDLAAIKEDLRTLTCQYADLAKQLAESVRQSAAKPTWGVTVTITALSSGLSALIIWVVTH